MELSENEGHHPGVGCRTAALRYVAQHCGWNHTEAACFGIGGGPVVVLYEHPERPWVTFRASSPRVETFAGVSSITGGG